MHRQISAPVGAPMMGNRNRGGVKASAVRLLSLCGAFGAIALLGITVAKAQDAEPRSYSNTPIGLNFLIAGALYSAGKLAFDPDLSVAATRGPASPSPCRSTARIH
jgi:hypothetical protein